MTATRVKRTVPAAVVLLCAIAAPLGAQPLGAQPPGAQPPGAQPPDAQPLDAQSLDALAKTPAWQPASPQNVRAEVLAWLDSYEPAESVRAEAVALWPIGEEELAGCQILDRLAQTFAVVDQSARQLVDLCAKPAQGPIPPPPAWLTDEKTPPLMANNLRLLYGRWLAHQRLFDESLEQLSGLQPREVVDPASLLFYQAVAYHQLLDRDAGLEAIKQLLIGGDPCPDRYVAVARLMQADLKELEEDTLDHIARRMDDISRRLHLGQADQPVRKVEDGVVESLDKLLNKLEEQARQQQAKRASGGQLQSSNPASESRIMGGKGPGKVDKKPIGDQQGWGNLPAKERQEAIQQIGRRFPSHYREAVEQYFKRLAKEQQNRYILAQLRHIFYKI